MPHWSSLRTPSATLNLVLPAINPRHLKPVDRFLVTIVPVQLADFVIAVKQVQPAFAAAAAAGAHLTDAVGGDGEVVDVVLGEGKGFIRGGVEGSSCWLC